jgi:hypothetical protein
MREEIINSIVSLKKKTTNEFIDIVNKKLAFETSKYSSKKEDIWHVIINDNKLKKTSEFLITYHCLTCHKQNTVSSTQFLRKVRKCKATCFQCQLQILNTTPDHNFPKNKGKTNPILSLREIYENSIQNFDTYSEEYKNSYFLSHLTSEDFERISPKIISLCSGKYTNLQDLEFWSIYKTNNQMLFSSVVYDKKNDIIFKANQPILKCDNCDSHWRAKSLEGFKNCYKVLCANCKLCNRTFKIRPFKNINNETIIYQSKLEKKFIDWCHDNNILCRNGPNIEYVFKDKCRTYRVDFQIENTLIEIKDFHIWHKNQLENGMWTEKMNSVDKFIQNTNYEKYLLITPQNWNDNIKIIMEILNKI